MIKHLLAGLTTILIVSILILSSVPPVSRDALTHHLAVPKLYLAHCGIYEIPSLVFSYYPMNLELLYLIPLYFGNDIAPAYIHFFFGLLTSFLVFAYLKRRINKIYALFGALFFLSIPVIVKLSITSYVDLGLVFFSTASIIFLIKWIESDFKFKHLIISALFCGLCLGTKYNAIIVFTLLSLFVVFAYVRICTNKNMPESVKSVKALSSGLMFIVVSLLVFSPWMIRNYIWTKNPVYPLYQSFFKKMDAKPVSYHITENNNITSKEENNNKSKKWTPFAIRRVIYNEPLLKILLIPLRIFFEGKDDNPIYFDGKLSPFLFFLPFFIFLRFKHDDKLLKAEKIILFSFSFLYILAVFFEMDMRIRYIAPVIPPLIILSVMGLNNIFLFFSARFSAISGRIYQCLLFISFAAIISFNVPYIIKQFDYVKPFEYLSGKIRRDEYIERYRPEYAAFKYANKNFQPDAKILCFFIGNRRYYSDRELIFDDNILINSVKHDGNIISVMRKKEITHLLIGYNLFGCWVNNNFNDGEKILLNKFFKDNTKIVLSKGGYGLFELKF